MSGQTFDLYESPARVEFPEADYVRLLGFPREYEIEGRSRELADLAREWYAIHGRPWIFARSARTVELNEKEVQFENSTFSPARLRSQFVAAGATEAVLVAVSAGAECEAEAARRWREEKPDEYFFIETYGSAVAEALVARAAGRICAWADQAGMAALPHYSPGYAGWPIAEQRRLWDLICDGNSANLRERLRVLDSGMLQPKKSQLAVFGLTRERDIIQPGSTLIPCVNCFLADCSFRRVPYGRVVRRSAELSKTGS